MLGRACKIGALIGAGVFVAGLGLMVRPTGRNACPQCRFKEDLYCCQHCGWTACQECWQELGRNTCPCCRRGSP